MLWKSCLITPRSKENTNPKTLMLITGRIHTLHQIKVLWKHHWAAKNHSLVKILSTAVLCPWPYPHRLRDNLPPADNLNSTELYLIQVFVILNIITYCQLPFLIRLHGTRALIESSVRVHHTEWWLKAAVRSNTKPKNSIKKNKDLQCFE